MATVYCTNCGHEVRGKFCTNCGTSIEEPAEQAAGADAGATTVIHAEDLRRMAEAEASPVPPTDTGSGTPSMGLPQSEPTAPGWNQGATGQPGQQWQTPNVDQQWQNPTPQAGQGWQQPPPQQPPPPSGWGAGQQPGAPPPGSGGYYAQQLGLPQNTAQSFSGAGTVAPSTDIGQLFSGAWNILMSRLNAVVMISLIFAGLLAAVGLVMGIGAVIASKVAFVGFLFYLAGFAAMVVVSVIPVASFIYMAQDAQAGTTSTYQDLIARARVILPVLAVALVIMYLIVGIGSIIVIGGIIAAFLLIFTPQAVVIDGASPTAALGQSFRTVTSDLGTSLVALIVLYLAMGVASFAAMIVLIPTFFLIFIPIVGWIIWLGIVGIIYGLFGAFAMGYITLLYQGLKAKAGAAPTPTYTGV